MGAYVGGKKILDLSRATIRGNVDFNGGNLTDVGTLQGTTIIAGAKSVVGYQNYVDADPATLVVSKDVERKFWKDDFSVDSSSQYTGDVADFTWDTANGHITLSSTTPKVIWTPESRGDSKISFVYNVSALNPTTQHNYCSLIFRAQSKDINSSYRLTVYNAVETSSCSVLLYRHDNSSTGTMIGSAVLTDIHNNA